MPAQCADGERGANGEARVFGDHRGECDAVDIHAEYDDEKQVEQDVRDVDRQEDEQRDARVLQAEKPADQRVVGERARRAPDADREVRCGVRLDVGLAAKQRQRDAPDGLLQQQDQQRDGGAHDQRLPQRDAQRVVVVRAKALRGDTRGSHAQEVHAEIEEREDRSADRDGAEIGRAVEMAHHARVDHAEQWHGDIRQDHRRRDTPHVPRRR